MSLPRLCFFCEEACSERPCRKRHLAVPDVSAELSTDPSQQPAKCNFMTDPRPIPAEGPPGQPPKPLEILIHCCFKPLS